ncbi:hypothetical protein C5S29_12375 [ANME-1 cluster archaeon GoMg3.2]|nr:hypothetical protein [ANME-1 cluster archaeon GoMg3.2]
MLRRFFRIGFGGCGCALVAHFIERVNVVYRDILLNDYKQLAKWENGLANEYRLMMRAKLKDLRELIFVQERETSYSLNEVEKYKKLDEYLDAWNYSLGELLANTPWMSYERDIVEEIRSVNRTMDRKAEAMKNPEEAVMLEGLMVDSFSGTGGVVGGSDKGRFLYNKMIKKTRPLIVNKYDKDILDSEGFDHHPELQMLPLSMKEVRYEVYEVISKAAEKGTEIGSRGNFFFVGLGGGTGTGVISPLAEQFGKGSRGYFTLGILGGKEDNKYLGSQQPWFRRCFNILLALNDLIATADLDGIILVDNEILMDRLEKRGELKNNKADLSDREELKKFLSEEFGMGWVENAEISVTELEIIKTKIIRISEAENSAKINIDDARQTAILKISDGRIYNLKVEEENGKRKILGKTYAEKIDDELTKVIYPAFGITACEESGSDIDWAQLKHHMKLEEQKQRSPIFVPCYASGGANTNTEDLINEALDTGMLANCEYKIADKIIGYVRDIKNEGTIKEILSRKFEIAAVDKEKEIKIIKRNANRGDVLRDVNAKIIVFESKTSKEGGSKENEVLLLLRNCNIKDTLYNRLKVAQGFVDLLVAFKELIEEEKKKSALSTEEIARWIIKDLINGKKDELGEKVEKILEKIPTDGIEAEYLFSWDIINQKDNEEAQNKLMWSLRNVFNIDWAEDLKINPKGNKIICEPAAGDRPVITIEKGAGGTAILKIGDDKTYNLTIIEENGEQKVYESENRASEKILQEAKSFLLPMDIGPSKKEETYKDLIGIVGILKEVVNEAIENLDEGNMSIFTKSIFKIKSAAASEDEVILTSMLAMGEDIHSIYRDALGDDKIDQLFNDFQRETLEDRAYVANSGGTDDYILTHRGENVLAEALREELDNKVSTAIEKPSELLKVIGTEKFLEFVKVGEGISFPKLLVLSLLYTKWEYVCGWDNICVGDGNEDGEFIEELSKVSNFEWVANDAVIKSLDKNTVSISNAEHLAEITICEKKEENRRFKEIRAGKHLTTRDIGRDDLNEDAIRNELDKVPRTDGFALPDKFKLKEEGVNKWRIINNTSNETEYYVRIEKGSLKIFGEAKILGLKVKEAEEGKLKIYKRREKEYEPITVEKGVTVNRPLDVPVSEVEIDKLKAEINNFKDSFEKIKEVKDIKELRAKIKQMEEEREAPLKEIIGLKNRIIKLEREIEPLVEIEAEKEKRIIDKRIVEEEIDFETI